MKRLSIDKSALRFGIPKRIRSESHRRYIRQLPCCATYSPFDVQAAHISKGTDGGKGIKPSDSWLVPLTVTRHRAQHVIGEITFWRAFGGIERARQLAQDLYAITGEIDAGKKLVRDFYFTVRGA